MLQSELAAKALAARKTKEAEDKAIADERYGQRKAKATATVQQLIEQMQKAAAGGKTSTEVVIPDCCLRPTGVGGAATMDDPIVDYFIARMREEGVTVTQHQSDLNHYKATAAWGSGE
jgi:hypothetical protein